MVQLELFSLQAQRTLSVSNSPSVSDPPSPDDQVHANKWKYFEYFCHIAEQKIYSLLEQFNKSMYKHITHEEIQELARSAVVDLLYRYRYKYIAPSLVEKFTVYSLKKYLRSENPLIVYHTEIPERLGL